jgi:hypothetical protein
MSSRLDDFRVPEPELEPDPEPPPAPAPSHMGQNPFASRGELHFEQYLMIHLLSILAFQSFGNITKAFAYPKKLILGYASY